jgi:hypothetical protein
MISYTLIDMKTLTDVLLNLIKFGFGSYEEMMKMSVDRMMLFNNWIVKDYEKDMKNKVEYDTSLIKMGCPLFRRK